ncbi:MAG: 2-polyprenyl-3-methyl-5-hydroxy-6-metoxy-1,4-benzoquinol methylase [Alteromonas naphthalenivorans]|jgi:2-polyprenyl-3-methyl-5-hydroxy-6-metoxy-1,4-benzoquinol methylase
MKQQSDIKEATKNVWGANPAGWTHAKEENPGTKAFFEKVLKERFGKEHDFLPEFVQYQDWKGKRVLEIGCGAGYDAYMFCKYGADYTGIDIVSENIDRTKKHLKLYNLKATVLEIDAEKLAFDKKFDLIYSFGVLHHIPNIDVVLQKIKVNLADDGVFKLAVYNKNSIFYWLHLWWWDHVMCMGFLKESFDTRLAQIEFTKSDSNPYVKVYTKKSITSLLEQNGFTVKNVLVKKLTHEDLPSVRFIWKFYTYIPQSFLNVLAKYWGWYLCVEAKKSK